MTRVIRPTPSKLSFSLRPGTSISLPAPARWMHADSSRAELDHATAIALPKGAVKEHGRAARVFGLDIGGTLTKLVHHSTRPNHSSLVCRVWPTAQFDTECLPVLLQLVHDSLSGSSTSDGVRLFTTGGGAYKFGQRLKEAFASSSASSTSSSSDSHSDASPGDQDVLVANEDEMRCLGAGLSFLQQHVADEFYTYDATVLDRARGVLVPKAAHEISRVPLPAQNNKQKSRQPSLLANAGSGVSYLLCPAALAPSAAGPDVEMTDPLAPPEQLQEPRRVGGTPLGGGTIFGMLKLVTGEDHFQNLLKLAAQGDRTKVDLTVGDIYSKAYSNIGLSGDRAAAILGGIGVGKGTDSSSSIATAVSEDESIQGYSKADVARSLVFGICYNIGLMAVLHAKIHGASENICFTGNLTHDNELVMGDIDFGVQVNSDYRMRATFMRHGGFLGAIGAWVRGMQDT